MAGSSPAKTKLAGEFLPLVAARFFPGQPCAKAGIQDAKAPAVAPCSCQGQALEPRFRARVCTDLTARQVAEISSLSALGGGEGWCEVVEPRARDCGIAHPTLPPLPPRAPPSSPPR